MNMQEKVIFGGRTFVKPASVVQRKSVFIYMTINVVK